MASVTILTDTFDSGKDGWTITNGTRATNQGYDDSYSLFSSNNNTLTQAYKTFDSDGAQATQIEFYFRETSNSHGSAIAIENAKGKRELVLACNNPQLDVYDGNGWTQLYSGNGYTRWIRHTVTFDWANGTYDLEWEDLQAGDLQTWTGRPLNRGRDTAKFVFNNYNNSAMDGDSAIDSWYDLFTVQVPGGNISGTVTDDDSAVMGGETVEVLNGNTGVVEDTTTTASDGTYTTSGLSDGTYDLYVRKPGYDTGTKQDVTISGSNVTGADISPTATEYTTSTDSTGSYSHTLPPIVSDQLANKTNWAKNEEDPYVLNGPVTIDYVLRPNPLTVGTSLTGASASPIGASETTPDFLNWIHDEDWDNSKFQQNVSHPSDVVELDSGVWEGELEAHEMTLEVSKQ